MRGGDLQPCYCGQPCGDEAGGTCFWAWRVGVSRVICPTCILHDQPIFVWALFLVQVWKLCEIRVGRDFLCGSGCKPSRSYARKRTPPISSRRSRYLSLECTNPSRWLRSCETAAAAAVLSVVTQTKSVYKTPCLSVNVHQSDRATCHIPLFRLISIACSLSYTKETAGPE